MIDQTAINRAADHLAQAAHWLDLACALSKEAADIINAIEGQDGLETIAKRLREIADPTALPSVQPGAPSAA